MLTVTRLFVQPFSFKPSFFLSNAALPTSQLVQKPSGQAEGSFFPSLMFVSATGLALSLERLTAEREIPSLIFPGVTSTPFFDFFPFRVA